MDDKWFASLQPGDKVRLVRGRLLTTEYIVGQVVRKTPSKGRVVVSAPGYDERTFCSSSTVMGDRHSILSIQEYSAEDERQVHEAEAKWELRRLLDASVFDHLTLDQLKTVHGWVNEAKAATNSARSA